MTACLLVNTSSGNKAGQKLLTTSASLAKTLVAYAQEIDFNNLTEQLRLAQQYPLILIAGGDGTISAVLAQLTKYSGRIGIIPLGTGNDLARELKIKKWDGRDHTLKAYFEAYLTLKPVRFVLWQARSGSQTWVFSNYLSIGFDAQVVSEFARQRQNQKPGVWYNRLSYAKHALKHIFHVQNFDRLQIAADGCELRRPHKIKSLIFSNIQSIMGLGRVNTQSDFSDNILELNVVSSAFSYLSMIIHRIRFFLYNNAAYQARKYEIVGLDSQAYLQIDGEPHRLNNPTLEITSYAAVEILTGKNLSGS